MSGFRLYGLCGSCRHFPNCEVRKALEARIRGFVERSLEGFPVKLDFDIMVLECRYHAIE